jgi:hypothetical protein
MNSNIAMLHDRVKIHLDPEKDPNRLDLRRYTRHYITPPKIKADKSAASLFPHPRKDDTVGMRWKLEANATHRKKKRSA